MPRMRLQESSEQQERNKAQNIDYVAVYQKFNIKQWVSHPTSSPESCRCARRQLQYW